MRRGSGRAAPARSAPIRHRPSDGFRFAREHPAMGRSAAPAGKGRQDARSRGVRNGWAAAAWALGRPDLLACFGTHGTPTAFVSLHHPSCRRAPGPSPFAASAVDARPQRHHPLDASACPATLSSRRPRGTISGTPIPAPRGLRFRPPVGHAAPRSVWKFEAWTYTLDNTCFSPELAGAA